MATITNFNSWLDGADLENYNDIYCLYRSVQDLEEWGAFKTTHKQTSKGNMYFVKCDYIEEVLMLASDKARDHLLNMLVQQHCGDMDMEGWYYYNHSMEKDD